MLSLSLELWLSDMIEPPTVVFSWLNSAGTSYSGSVPIAPPAVVLSRLEVGSRYPGINWSENGFSPINGTGPTITIRKEHTMIDELTENSPHLAFSEEL